ncbi:MAG: sulfide/dihydroorotate dehydrogenase-like FAD/NAD-binding protein [Bacteroidetes bacterium]|jgi:ferredoxin--NADP+ reductase|nr:sulfide/dihydroorotate dehydrogenase-like FAD/NAD-binding protein [Bacteroidota bacterium]MCL5034338.1 sulfide/dihydroorotate dehydrogenase-like FAD/NAD-binding protein [Bacteroidota bacterium]
MFQIISKETPAKAITKFVIQAPYVARKHKAGNFVIIRVNDHGERIPLTIVDSDPAAGTITIMVQTIGKTTKLLSTLNEGDYLLDVAGPLGNATPIHSFGTVVCIGGGVGTAEVYPIARALKGAGNKLVTIVGARSRDLVILEDELCGISDEFFVTTDDGSYGMKGLVTGALDDYLKKDTDVKAVYAIGPIIMMKAVSDFTRPKGIKTFVSLNPIMMDGTGMCGACRVTIGGETKFACVDGPEFDGHLVDFDELITRNRTYMDLEKQSLERFDKELVAHHCASHSKEAANA